MWHEAIGHFRVLFFHVNFTKPILIVFVIKLCQMFIFLLRLLHAVILVFFSILSNYINDVLLIYQQEKFQSL